MNERAGEKKSEDTRVRPKKEKKTKEKSKWNNTTAEWKFEWRLKHVYLQQVTKETKWWMPFNWKWSSAKFRCGDFFLFDSIEMVSFKKVKESFIIFHTLSRPVETNLHDKSLHEWNDCDFWTKNRMTSSVMLMITNKEANFNINTNKQTKNRK